MTIIRYTGVNRKQRLAEQRRRALATMALCVCACVVLPVGIANSSEYGGCTAAKLPIIRNGSFENGVSPPNSDLRTLFATKTSFNRDISSWAVKPAFRNLTGSIDWNQRFEASDGQLTVDLDGECSPGAIRQKVNNLIVRHRHRVFFGLAGNPEGPPTVKQLRIDVDGKSFKLEFDTTNKSPENMGWTRKYLTFEYSGVSPVLKFTSSHPTTAPHVTELSSTM